MHLQYQVKCIWEVRKGNVKYTSRRIECETLQIKSIKHSQEPPASYGEDDVIVLNGKLLK